MALEEVLEGEGFTKSNILRAIKGLWRERVVGFDDARRKEDAVVSLPLEPKPMSEEEVFALIGEADDAERAEANEKEETWAEG